MASPRRHHAWTVLGLCFLAILCAQGVRLSFGAFVRPSYDATGSYDDVLVVAAAALVVASVTCLRLPRPRRVGVGGAPEPAVA